MEIAHLHILFAVYLIFIMFTAEYYAQTEVYEDNYYNLDPEFEYSELSNTTECEEETSYSFTTKIITHTTSDQKIKCDEDQILFYLAKLQVINPEGILLIATYKDIEHLCRKIVESLDSIDNVMQTCIPLPEDHLYMQLIAGLRVLNSKLCVYANYQSVFRKYMKCYQELHDEYLDCVGPTDWTENMEIHELCDQFKAISDCYYTLTAVLCGIEAAKILKELVVQVITAVIWSDCPNVHIDPVILDPMPEIMNSKSFCNTSINFIIVIILINIL
ncbi:PREDICTED: uncharacterized protein LOC106786695 isoform X1 [Polistes canadensis]|uniref:uncharacterized protein LOC106786695 isoform X1 n=1 Tax=Polistes canadensis TaxID=91411 RepID=UPI000718CEF4|nr:PREDICTED: uncharacterized protein LOC106786695 isoform X1 [Polistes canadensis]